VQFPDQCVRGLLNVSYVTKLGLPAAHAFEFDEPPMARQDGCVEQSINWYDDEGAVAVALIQTKSNGELQFKAGVAVFPRSALDQLKSHHAVGERIQYERAEKPDNKYHGNILLKRDTPGPERKMIQSFLAMSSKVRLRE